MGLGNGICMLGSALNLWIGVILIIRRLGYRPFLYPGLIGPHMRLGTFCPLGHFVLWDVLAVGHLSLGRFVPWDVVPWDFLPLGHFVLGCFQLRRFVLGHFLCASIKLADE